MARVSGHKVKQIPMDKVHEPGAVVRMDINQEDLQELADNIAEIGLLQPILVRAVGDHFEVISGHRRYLAHRLLNLGKIACITVSMDDVECAVARGSENLGRVDISPIEEAAIYGDLRDNHGLTAKEIGERFRKSVGVVKRRLDLLKMPPQLQMAVHRKQISYSVAEELWSLGDNSGIDYFLGYAVDHGATVSVVRGWVKDHKDAKRRESSDVGERGGEKAPLQTRPVYVACDLCREAMEIGTETLFRTCPKCKDNILQSI